MPTWILHTQHNRKKSPNQLFPSLLVLPLKKLGDFFDFSHSSQLFYPDLFICKSIKISLGQAGGIYNTNSACVPC